MGYSYVPPLRPLFPPFQNFLLPQDPTFAWNHKFLENLHFKGSKSLNKLTLASLIVSYHVGPWSPGGYSAENGVQLCATLKIPLSRPPDPSLKPPFQNFLVPEDPTFALNHKFLENLHFKGWKLKKSSVLMPNTRSSFSFKSLKLDKKLVL